MEFLLKKTSVLFDIKALGIEIPVVIDTWSTWNSNKELSQYDVIFKWWPWAVEYVIEQAAPKLGATSAAQTVEKLTQALATSICTTAQTYCKGANQQYKDAGECTTFLTKEIPFGPAYFLGNITHPLSPPFPPPKRGGKTHHSQPTNPTPGKNNLLCRMVHQNMGKPPHPPHNPSLYHHQPPF